MAMPKESIGSWLEKAHLIEGLWGEYWREEVHRGNHPGGRLMKLKNLSIIAGLFPINVMFFELGAIVTMMLQYAEIENEDDRDAFEIMRDVSGYWENAASLEPTVCNWPGHPVVSMRKVISKYPHEDLTERPERMLSNFRLNPSKPEAQQAEAELEAACAKIATEIEALQTRYADCGATGRDSRDGIVRHIWRTLEQRANERDAPLPP
jgi:hypothetical protein